MQFGLFNYLLPFVLPSVKKVAFLIQTLFAGRLKNCSSNGWFNVTSSHWVIWSLVTFNQGPLLWLIAGAAATSLMIYGLTTRRLTTPKTLWIRAIETSIRNGARKFRGGWKPFWNSRAQTTAEISINILQNISSANWADPQLSKNVRVLAALMEEIGTEISKFLLKFFILE